MDTTTLLICRHHPADRSRWRLSVQPGTLVLGWGLRVIYLWFPVRARKPPRSRIGASPKIASRASMRRSRAAPPRPCLARSRWIHSGQPAGVCPRGHGEVAEWLKAPHSKCGIRVTVSGVRIPPPPLRAEPGTASVDSTPEPARRRKTSRRLLLVDRTPDQIPQAVGSAVIGNAGTLVVLGVGSRDGYRGLPHVARCSLLLTARR